MQALTLPAKRGWQWLLDAFQIFRKAQFMFPLVVLSYWMMMVIMNSIPVIGPVAATVCIPVFSVSLMNVCRLLERGEAINPTLLFSGFKENLQTLLVLGVIYLLIALGILGLTSLFDNGTLFNFFVADRESKEAVSGGGDVMLAAQIGLALFIPLMMAYWYAPVLVAWHGLTAGKALFFSFVACLRNWRAFVVYSASIFILGAFLPAFLLHILADTGRTPLIMLTLILVFMGLPLLYASFYVSYRDVFVTVDEDA